MKKRGMGLAGLLSGAVLIGCSTGDSGGSTPGPDTPGPGDPLVEDPSVPPPGAAQCGGGCAADLVAARAALEAGSYAAAYEQYKCADTPEAAFGAGLTRLLLMVEGSTADSLLADLGMAPLAATDLIGSDSITARLARRWEGGGTLSVTGDLTATVAFDAGQQTTGEWSDLDAQQWADTSYTYLNVSFDSNVGLVAGTSLPVTTDCTAAYPQRQLGAPLREVSLGFEAGGVEYSCSLPWTFPVGACQADGGRIVVTADVSTPGQQAAYDFENLLLECYGEDGSDTPLWARASGSVNGVIVTPTVDTTGLHAMFSDGYDFAAGLPPATTVATLQQHGVGLTPELEEAACYFRLAGGGQGMVFTIPGAITGRADVAVSQGDSQVLGAGLLVSAAFLQLATAAEVPLTIGDLTCSSDDPACPTESELTTAFNQGFGETFHADRFAVAQRLLTEAVPLLDAGLGNLDATSLLVANSKSMPGLLMIRDLVRATHASLTAATVLPHVSPVVEANLSAFFAAARNPRDIPLPVLKYAETCDEFECWSSTEIDPEFVQQYTQGMTNADWVNGTYEWADEDAITDALNETLGNAIGQFMSAD